MLTKTLTSLCIRVRLAGIVSVVGLCCFAIGCGGDDQAARVKTAAQRLHETRLANPRSLVTDNKRITLWWDAVPKQIRKNAHATDTSNVHPTDYVGAAACQKCHQKNYDGWATHPHRWMNALAEPSTVKGDFSGVNMSYMGGTTTFLRDGDEFYMLLERDTLKRRYRITQTIGSRFYQYYVGKLISGPEPTSNPIYTTDHVLPFGYWLDEHEWVPIVHVSNKLRYEPPDRVREDPFLAEDFSPYTQCNSCHTTFAFGDVLSRDANLASRHAPQRLHWELYGYLQNFHSDLIDGQPATEFSDSRLKELSETLNRFEAPEHALNLGISCEACHLGAKAHAEGKVERPEFFPHSPHLLTATEPGSPVEFGRTHANVNWVCGRCHTGTRPQLAAGMATWNSTEYSDAMRGSCYTKLQCIDCHNPHQATGRKWSRSPAEDDASCLRCHEELKLTASLTAHTHHAAGSEGSRCMNCHMPRLNEGLQDVVRTHMIFSPTNREMIAKNHPNACNLCHVDRSTTWTTEHLAEWYGASKSEKMAPDANQSAALTWLKSDNEAVRLIAVDAMVRAKYVDALPQVLEALDDPFLLNRQFAGKGIQTLLKVRLSDFGYRFYMMSEERREPIERIRRHLLEPKTSQLE